MSRLMHQRLYKGQVRSLRSPSPALIVELLELRRAAVWCSEGKATNLRRPLTVSIVSSTVGLNALRSKAEMQKITCSFWSSRSSLSTVLCIAAHVPSGCSQSTCSWGALSHIAVVHNLYDLMLCWRWILLVPPLLLVPQSVFAGPESAV